MNQELQELFEQRKKITQKINECMKQNYTKYKGEMKSEVKDDNPYSRLMALKTMGVVENYDKIKSFTILIVGVGGVGSVVAEMLTRCGIGKLILYDYDNVEIANMNRLFFTPQQVGLSKVEAAQETLQFINPEIQIESYNLNITTNDGYKHLQDRIQNGSLVNKKIDLVLCCVDNYSARMSINMLCCQLDQNWIESGVNEDAMSSHIQIMIPGETACFACATPLAVQQNTENQIKREGVCAASLPTTMGITAAFMAQNVLKLLLEFGELSYCLTYNARVDFINNYMIQPNSDCILGFCQQLQQKKNDKPFLQLREQEQKIKNIQTCVNHDDNEWEIENVDEEILEKQEQKIEINDQQSQSLEELMQKLQKL